MIKLKYESGDTFQFLFNATKRMASGCKQMFMCPNLYEEHLFHVEDNDKLYKQAMNLEFVGGWKILRCEDLGNMEVVLV